MCLKFDPEENVLKQTCSGKCKNRCGFKPDQEEDSLSSSDIYPKKVQIEMVTGKSQIYQIPFRANYSALEKNRTSKTEWKHV